MAESAVAPRRRGPSKMRSWGSCHRTRTCHRPTPGTPPTSGSGSGRPGPRGRRVLMTAGCRAPAHLGEPGQVLGDLAVLGVVGGLGEAGIGAAGAGECGQGVNASDTSILFPSSSSRAWACSVRVVSRSQCSGHKVASTSAGPPGRVVQQVPQTRGCVFAHRARFQVDTGPRSATPRSRGRRRTARTAPPPAGGAAGVPQPPPGGQQPDR